MKLPATGELSGRAVEEWIGATPDTPVPPRVVLRVLLRQNRRCAMTGALLHRGYWIVDHRTPLADGGENREMNLQLITGKASAKKTAWEATDRAKVRAITEKHLGIKQSSRPIPGSRNTPYRRKINGQTELR
jgi:5-methylcytosine-specific restriction protein A